MTTTLIRTQDLRMSYGSNEVLKGVDLRLERGEVVVLLGPNGAGKTTTVEILEGFRAPSAGLVEVLETDPLKGDDAWRARVGVVLQSWRDHSKWRVHELLSHMGDLYAPYGTAERPKPWPTQDLLERVGLAGKAKEPLSRLSGGQRRRLDVALGLVGRPELVFLDEPTAGFDPEARRDFHDLVRELADLDVGVLLTTHDLDEAEKLADRILILADGRIVADGSPDQLRHKVSETSEVRWRHDDALHIHAAQDATSFLRELLQQPGDIRDIEVRRASLEDAYMAITQTSGTQTGGNTPHGRTASKTLLGAVR